MNYETPAMCVLVPTISCVAKIRYVKPDRSIKQKYGGLQ
jgi:hypothetical protein